MTIANKNPGLFELVPSCLYDSCDLADATKPGIFRYSFFCKPIGHNPDRDLVVKGDGWFTRWLRTNLFDANRLSAPQEFIVKRLNVLFLSDGRPLRVYETELYGKASVHFTINAKTYWRSPAWQCASPLAIFETPENEIKKAAWAAAGANFDHPTKWMGVPTDGEWLSWQEFFQVEIDVEGPIPEKTQLAVHLDGPLARAVV